MNADRNQDDVPVDIRDFVLRYIETVTQLEILLLLFSEPGREWNPAVISSRLSSNESAVTERLEGLRAQKLVAMNRVAGITLYRFLFENAEVSHRVRGLAEAYRLKKARVIEIIYFRGF